MINISVIRNVDRIKTYARGAVITGSGDGGTLLFVILKGKAGVYPYGTTQEADLIRTLGAGDIFSDPGLLLDSRAAYTTVSLSDTVLLPIQRLDILDFLQEEPALAYELMRELCLRLEQTNTAYKTLIVQHDTQRRSRDQPPVAAEIRGRTGNNA